VSYLTWWIQNIRIFAANTRYGSLLLKLIADGYILQNGAATVADTAGMFSEIFPLIDNEAIFAALGINNTNTGPIQAALQFKDVSMGGIAPLVETLGHIANGALALYATADLVGNLTSGHLSSP
jgi:hypothetical protein